MVLKLYGHPNSTCTTRVATVLHEKKVPFEFIIVDIKKGAHQAPEFLEKQPFGQVPVLDDDGYILYESRAISKYIATKYAEQGTPLIPTDLKAIGLFEQAASVEAFNFDPYASGIAYEKIFKIFRNLETDEVQLNKHITTLGAKLDVYEKILSKQKYLAGDEITLVDLFHIPYGSKLFEAGAGDVINKRPNVKRWFEDISNRESWLAVKDGVTSTA